MADPSTFSEGELQITLDAQVTKPVQIKSSRPLQVSKLFIGNSVDQVGDRVPLLYNICATAQTHASLLALNRARAQPLNQHVEIARAMLVLTETVREHLFRICIDWPQLFGVPLDSKVLPSISQLLAGMTNCLFDPAGAFSNHSILVMHHSAFQMLLSDIEKLIESQLSSGPLQQWLSMKDFEGVAAWARKRQTLAACAIDHVIQQGWSGYGQSPVSGLPQIQPDQLIYKLKNDNANGFIQSPSWQGEVRETSALTRQHFHHLVQSLMNEFGNGLLPRMMARLVELALLPSRIEALAGRLEANERSRAMPADGLAQVEAARGRLVHYAEVENDRVTDYRILAPTEWNFHPQGVMALSLRQLMQETSTDQPLEQIAKCLINAIDPCVGYQLDIR